jgi:LPS-assembly lipoprotein
MAAAHPPAPPCARPCTPPRCRWLTLAAALGLAVSAGLTGCGFELRQTPPLPFSRIALTGFPLRSPLVAELRERLSASVQVVDTPGQAEVVLQARTEARSKSVVASTASGQVRELTLRLRFEFRLVTPSGRELVPPTELLQSRDMSYSETFALGKAQEEAEIYAAMQADTVQQVLRRLSRARLAPGAPVAASTSASAPAISASAVPG